MCRFNFRNMFRHVEAVILSGRIRSVGLRLLRRRRDIFVGANFILTAIRAPATSFDGRAEVNVVCWHVSFALRATEVVAKFVRLSEGFYVVEYRVGRREQVGRPVGGVDQGGDHLVHMEANWSQPGDDVGAVKGQAYAHHRGYQGVSV